MTDQDANRATRMASDDPVFIAGRGRPGHVLPLIEQFPCGADASDASIVEWLAAPDAADIEFEAPQSGRLFRAADFS
ncbi:type II toxin-antitoxin system Phd/YefM family antitoxin [Burkholderia sp. S171]|uniref:type II toxin-antitoxin system Phd/YefM family antitoxin n=1 Tax=Burkholderia sp. S171 TaxID=1641860 RepID=UPI00131D97DC|nr:type II toxin-antitoxin system Phd/YefM family antitoxin [Burkholderia sp. S171]